MNWMRSAKGRCPVFEPSGVRPDAFTEYFKLSLYEQQAWRTQATTSRCPGWEQVCRGLVPCCNVPAQNAFRMWRLKLLLSRRERSDG